MKFPSSRAVARTSKHGWNVDYGLNFTCMHWQNCLLYALFYCISLKHTRGDAATLWWIFSIILMWAARSWRENVELDHRDFLSIIESHSPFAYIFHSGIHTLLTHRWCSNSNSLYLLHWTLCFQAPANFNWYLKNNQASLHSNRELEAVELSCKALLAWRWSTWISKCVCRS